MKNLLYPFLKRYAGTALRFYFRKWQVTGTENIPAGPVIFVPNHQNAFLDAVLIACSSRVNPWFMTRSDVFKNPQVKKILTKLQMLPVYRFRDGYQTLKQNDSVLNECVDKIHSGESLLIFAEGNHGERFQLRPLQKGVARIAFSLNPEKNVCIIPVGIQYDVSKTFRSRVLVNFGKPIYIADSANDHFNSREQYDDLLIKIKNDLEKLILHIEDDNYDDKFQFLLKQRNFSSDLHQQLKNDQEVIMKFPEHTNAITKEPQPSKLQWSINQYARINLILPGYIINKMLLRNVKDPQFGNSIKFAAGMVLTPAFWLLQAGSLFLLSNSLLLSAVYLVSLPVSLRMERKD